MKLVVDVVLDLELSQAIDGYEKDINELTKKALMKPEEGKSPLKMNCYFSNEDDVDSSLRYCRQLV